MTGQTIDGIYAAAITPFTADLRPDHDQLIAHLTHLQKRGCHGVLIGGTTGETQSLSVDERFEIIRVVSDAKLDLRVLVGTGAASIEDAVLLTKEAFDHDILGVVIIPPFFYKEVSVEGLLAFYNNLIQRAVPQDGRVFLYHNPVTTCTAVPTELIRALVDKFPRQVAGIKDSGSNIDHTRRLLEEFDGFNILVGDDRHLEQALAAKGAGAITGLSNLFPDLLVDVFDNLKNGMAATEAQARVSEAHHKLNGLPRIAAVKAILKAGGIIRSASVRPPLRGLTDQEMGSLRDRFNFEQHLELVSAVSH